MQSKPLYENSYACLLDLVLEDDFGDARGSPIVEETRVRRRKQRLRKRVDVDVRSVGGVGGNDDENPKPTTTSASTSTSTCSSSSSPSPAPATRPRNRNRDRDRFSLLEIDDELLPEVLKFNRFIETGYRPPMTRRECLCSVVPFFPCRSSPSSSSESPSSSSSPKEQRKQRQERPPLLHNETFNVATHLLPLLSLALFAASGLSADHWPGEGGRRALLLHLLPVALCLAGSVCYHALMNDVRNYRKYLSVDVCGILVLAVDGTRAMSARPVACAAAGGGGLASFRALELLRAALASLPFSPIPPSSPSSSPDPFSLSSLSPSLSSAALARDAALAGYASLVALAALRALRGETAAQRGWPLLALLLVRLGVLSARALEVGGLLGESSSDPSSPPSHAASLRLSLRWYALAELASFSGGLINVLRVPERFVKRLPPLGEEMGESDGDDGDDDDGDGSDGYGGRKRSTKRRDRRWRLVDFAFNSHNLMHLLSLVALWCYHAAATEDRRHWVEHGCGGV